MINTGKAELLFAFLILFTLSMSIISYPLSLTSYVYGESDDGGDDGDSSNNQEETSYTEDDGSKGDTDDDTLDHQDSEGETQSSETEGETQSSETEGETQSSETEGETQSSETEGETQSSETEGETQSSETEGETQSSETGSTQSSETGSTQSSETGSTQSSETGSTQSSELQGTSFFASILSHFQSTPSQTGVDSKQNPQELSNVNSLIENCDPADPACSESPCDPADPACQPGNCDPEDPACNTESDCGDGIDNDGDEAIDGEDADCGEAGEPPIGERESSCSDGIDNDGDGKIDDEDNDCQPGGPCPSCLPTGGGTGGNNDGGGDNGNVNDGGGDNGNVNDGGGDNGNVNDGGGDNGNVNDGGGDNGNVNDGGGDNGESFLAQAEAQAVQGEDDGMIYYVLIENGNNETKFVPDKVTLTDGFTVVWINNDNLKDRQLIITSDTGNPLFNSPIQSNNFVKYKFESAGTFFYSDPENPQFNGAITILPSGESEETISKPIQGIDQIISSLGFK